MKNSPYVKSILKALHILDIFGFDDPLGQGFSLSELSGRTGLAPNTLCKILKTMVKADYLTQDSKRRYHSSHKTCLIQMATASHADLSDKLSKIIQQKSHQLASPLVFATLSFGERKLILQTTDSDENRPVVRHGASTDDFIYTKPTGRILVSYANSVQLSDILDRWGYPLTNWDDINDLASLIKVREGIRSQAYCQMLEQDQKQSIAVPVKVERCNFLGALGLVANQADPRWRQGEIRQQLHECADQIAAALS